jgi:hypothetical protein
MTPKYQANSSIIEKSYAENIKDLHIVGNKI